MSRPARVHARLLRDPVRYLLASLAVLLPCYWQPRIQAGDLSSHIYNAWLTTLIANGRTEGLAIAHQTTNVLFDLILTALLQPLGAAWAQRLSVSLAVLIFVWGAFAFVSAVSARPAWRLLPCFAMLAYGWVFHMGFFNFYLSIGLCFWALAALQQPTHRRAAIAAVVFGVAYTAHGLPVLWAMGLMAYSWISSRMPARRRAILLIVTLAFLVVVQLVVRYALLSRWSPTQLASATGADQLLVFDNKYALVMAALLLIWVTSFVDLLRKKGGRAVVTTIPLHWCVLTSAGIFILPGAVLIPGFHHALVYVGERMSLGLGVCLCALLATAPLRRVQLYPLVATALIFFGFLFRDERSLNRFEDRVDLAVAGLPDGQRLVSPILDSDLRANALTHMIDRACVGRCYSYANYEPSTAVFRIRAVKPNPYVIADYGDSFRMQNGEYVFKESELPLYAIFVTESGEVGVRRLKAGVPSGISKWRVLQNRMPQS